MRLLLIHVGARDFSPTEPLGIAALSGHLVASLEGWEITLVDEVALRSEISLREALQRFSSAPAFDVVGLSSMWPKLEHFRECVDLVTEFYPHARLIAGGSIVAAFGARVLEWCPAVEVAVQGEGEDALVDLLRDQSPSKVPNTWFRSGEGLVQFSFARQVHPYLVAAPDRTLWVDDSTRVPYVAANMEVSRGCDYGACTFCHLTAEAGFHRAVGIDRYRVYRPAPLENAWKDYRNLIDLDVPRINFVDEELFGGRGDPLASRGAEFLARVAAEGAGIDVPKSMFARSPDITRESVDLLRTSGVTSVFVGIESGSQSQLRLFGKGAEIQHSVRAVDLLRSAGIRLKAGFIMLHPLSTCGEIIENVEFIEKLNLYPFLKTPLSLMDVVPGTSYQRIVSNRAPECLDEMPEEGWKLPWRPSDPTLLRHWLLIQEMAKIYESASDAVRAIDPVARDGRLSEDGLDAIEQGHRMVCEWLLAIAQSEDRSRHSAKKVDALAAGILEWCSQWTARLGQL
jgi:anaerobic magnesium-protoporphyrin IX monomethyl ester cyclase